jgi:hypothetical protein
MSVHHFPKSKKARPAREQLRDAPTLPFLLAMDLVMIQADEMQRNAYRRVPIAEVRAELMEHSNMKRAASQAKLAWLAAMKHAERELAGQLITTEDPHLRDIGFCLQDQHYKRLAR